MDSLADFSRPRLADLEHYDEPSPEDAIELDAQVWRHIDSLLVGFDEECDDEADPDEDEGDEILDDEGEPGDGSDVDGGEDPPPAPSPPARDSDLLDSDRDAAPPIPGPAGPPGPLAGALDDVAFRLGQGTFGVTGRGRRDGTRPGDAPGWKGGRDA